jgi:hypothetical protein
MNKPVLIPASSKAFSDLERYLLNTVRPRFLKAGKLSAFDFFCIVIWKANRAKSKVAAKLLERGAGDLEATVSKLTQELAKAKTDEQRLHCLIEDWKLRLPMASAILAVLYPDTFTVYDVRVTDVLGRFKYIADIKPFSSLWARYQEFCNAVAEATPGAATWRERDHILWGESFARQLREDIRAGFPAR